jgi:hypothetical protein
MGGRKHTSKEVVAAIEYAIGRGWNFREMAHFGRLFCPRADRDGCQIGVNGTPRNPEDHAKQIRRAVDRCPHYEEGQ